MFWCWFGNKGCTSWQEHPPTVIEIQTVILLWLRHLGSWHDFCLEVSFHNKFEILSLRPSPCPTVPCSVDPAWPESQSALWSRWRTSINAPDQNYQGDWGWMGLGNWNQPFFRTNLLPWSVGMNTLPPCDMELSISDFVHNLELLCDGESWAGFPNPGFRIAKTHQMQILSCCCLSRW